MVKSCRSLLWIAALIMVMGIAAGCSGKEDVDVKATISVLANDERWFFQQYGNLFNMKVPHIELQIIPTRGLSDEEIMALIDERRPDVLTLNSGMYRKLAEDGALADLQPYIEGDGFDVDQIYPALTDFLRMLGGGNLMGLAPTFYGMALFYNQDLFDQFRIAHPSDGISWEEVVLLAQRFPVQEGNDRIYGFSQSFRSDPYSLARMIAELRGISPVDAVQMRATIDTSEWSKIFEWVVDLFQSGAIYDPSSGGLPASDLSPQERELLNQNVFLLGRSAMTIENSYFLDMLKLASPAVAWEAVTVPVDPENPGMTNSISVSNIFAIHANSPNAKAAWELVKFVNSDEMARLQSRSSAELLARPAHMKERDGHNVEAFYRQNIGMDRFASYFDERVPSAFYGTLHGTANSELNEVIYHNKPLDEAIRIIQDKVQAVLETEHGEQMELD